MDGMTPSWRVSKSIGYLYGIRDTLLFWSILGQNQEFKRPKNLYIIKVE